MRTLIGTVRAWEEDGVEVGRAVVVRTFGSAPRPEGATLLVAADGRLAGSVSGGCVEGAAAEEIARARRDGVSRVVRYGISDERAWDVGLACGGTVDVLVEPFVRPEVVAAADSPGAHAIAIVLPVDAPPATLVPHATGAGAPPAASLVVEEDGSISLGTLGDAATDAAFGAAAARRLAEGRSGIEDVRVSDTDRQVFVEVFPARPRLVVIGAVQVAIPLVALARTIGYETVVIDGRAAFATEERFPDVGRLVLGWPDEVADEVGLGPSDAVAVLTHDPKFDEPAIVAALARGCRYVGRGRQPEDAGGSAGTASGRGRERGRPRASRGPDRAGPRRPVARGDGARDPRRDRRRAARRVGPAPRRDRGRARCRRRHGGRRLAAPTSRDRGAARRRGRPRGRCRVALRRRQARGAPGWAPSRRACGDGGRRERDRTGRSS